MEPVTDARIKIAQDWGMVNAQDAARACRTAGIPFWAACALLQKESGGKNIYGNDKGGALSGFPDPVDRSNFAVFLWLVNQGQPSNGVGPCQITWKGYFPDMMKKNLKPWRPHDNMVYGFGLLSGHYETLKSWELAGKAYNGADAYGRDFVAKCNEWRKRLNIKGDPVK